MRLLDEEYQEILKKMDYFGLQNQYTLVKRKGWIHIEVNGKSFAFHRKKKSELRNGKFMDSIQYFIRGDEMAQQPAADFQEVMHRLHEWLDQQTKPDP